MKKVIRCLGCEKLTRLYGSYKVKVDDRTKSILTGEVKNILLEGNLCPDCAKQAGYRIKKAA